MLEVIVSRRSVRAWTRQAVAEKDIQSLLEAAMSAPTAMNRRPWQFVVLTEEMLERAVAVNSNTPRGAPVAILVCQDVSLDGGSGYAIQDCSAATQNILLAAHAKGLGAVWTTVFPPNVAPLRDLLGLPNSIAPFSLIPIGYPKQDPAPSASRFDPTRVHRNHW